MKYPQLVSTRAVNAISDWLVSRLEQLGVEAPQIYTRLLLSLLQSTVQINDPIEFSNLEAFFANRKGGNRRYLPCDTDTLKKLNAVQCLREIVSSEQEIETIEHLVDELCEKLKDIEKQTSEIEDESRPLVVLTTVISPSSNSNRHDQQQQQQQQSHVTNTSTAAARHSDNHRQQQQHHQHQHNVERAHILSLQQSVGGGGAGAGAVAGGGACGEAQQRIVGQGGAIAIINTTVDNETDPKKRYFRAFPALSKEMEEDSFRVLRRNAKSLTWPVNRGNINLTKIDSNSSNSSSGSSNSSHNSSSSSSASSSASLVVANSFLFDTSATADIDASGGGGGAGAGGVVELAKSIKQQRAIGLVGSGVYGGVGVGNIDSLGGSSTGVKRKPKRRRNQAFSKGKTIQNTRRSGGVGAAGVGSGGGGGGGGGGGAGVGGRNTTPTYWDTDFEGCWEMGPDLIKDFIAKQNCRRVNSRNRSTSESAAYSIKEELAAAAEAAAATAAASNHNNNNNKMRMATNAPSNQMYATERQLLGDGDGGEGDRGEGGGNVDGIVVTAAAASPQQLPLVDISFCCDDEYDDTLASVAELPADNCLGATDAGPARRLYQREVSFGSRERTPDVAAAVMAAAAQDDCVAAGVAASVDGDDFAQFKAKFNSSVEALWKDAEQPASEAAATDGGGGGGGGIYSLPVPIAGGGSTSSSSSISAVAPFKQDLRNFWANYYGHRLPPLASQEASKFNENGIGGGVGGGAGGCLSYSDTSMRSMLDGVGVPDVVNTSDYFSMPSNLGEVIGAGSGSGGGVGVAENRNSPIGVFFQNSIWSDKSIAGAGDTDESFYLKVWNSSHKALHSASTSSSASQQQQQQQSQQQRVESNGNGGGNGFHFPPYKASKWSEGINGVPQVKCGNNNNSSNNNNNIGDCIDSPSASISTTSCSSAAYAQVQVGAGVGSGAATAYNWDTPVLLLGGHHSLKADLKSWSASNPLSLTGMYGSLAVAGADQPDAGGSKRLSGNNFYNAANFEAEAAAAIDADADADANDDADAAADDDDDDDERRDVAAPVTLPNHCTQSSGFTAYGRMRTSMRVQQQQQQLNYAAQFAARPKERHAADDENLLTSERTHFHPIKTYADGHTFDICSALDVLEYERSASGGLYLLADKYLEYTRNDNFLAEEDATNVGASAAPLYASSNCEAAMSAAAASRQAQTRQRVKEFVLKFRVQNCEIACQTDDEAEVARRETAAKAMAAAMAAKATASGSSQSDRGSDHPLRLLFTGGAVSAKQGSLACSNAIEALNKAVAAAAKATAADETKRNCWLTSATTATAMTTSRLDSGGVTAAAAANIWANATTIASEANVSGGGVGGIDCDEVDFYAGNGNAAAIERQWARRDVVVGGAQKCTHNNTITNGIDDDDDDVSSSSINNNNNNNNDLDHLNNNNINNNNNNNNGDSHGRSIHTLWGMCAACNNELKSMPANRLLRDELEVEGDEIMSDLKYMQDLYIERAERSSASMDSDSDWGDVEVDLDDGDADCETETETATMDDDVKPFVAAHGNIGRVGGGGGGGIGGIGDGGVSQLFGDYDVRSSDTQMVLQKVNRLIADLLRPDGGGNDDSIGSACGSGNDDANFDVERKCATTAGKTFDGANIWGNASGGVATAATTANEKSHNIWQPPTPPPTAPAPTTTVTATTALIGGVGVGDDPLELLRQYNLDAPAESALVLCSAKDQKFLSQLSWEHTYLAEIWQKSTPPPLNEKQQQQLPMERMPPCATDIGDIGEAVDMPQQQQHNITNELLTGNDESESNARAADEHANVPMSMSTVVAATDDDDDDAIATTIIATGSNANKNTNSPTAAATPAVSGGSEAALKRVQQFLNATVAAAGNNQSSTTNYNYNYNLINRNRKRRHSASQNCFHHYHQHHLHHHHQHYQQYQPHNRKEQYAATNNNPNAHNNNNNNNLDIADLNCFNMKLCTGNSGDAATTDHERRAGAAALLLDDIVVQKLINNSLRSVLNARNNSSSNNNNNNNNMDDAANAADAAFSLLCGNGNVGGGVSTTQPSHRQTIITCKYWATIDPAMIATTDGISNVNGRLLVGEENMCDGMDDGGMGALNAECGGALFDKNATILKHVTMATRPLTR